eukprot:COSAG01_NODE_181_length_22873_cov_12.951392_6_plen_307_part_00
MRGKSCPPSLTDGQEEEEEEEEEEESSDEELEVAQIVNRRVVHVSGSSGEEDTSYSMQYLVRCECGGAPRWLAASAVLRAESNATASVLVGQGYDSDEDTWESLDDLSGCRDLVDEYERRAAAYGPESLRTSVFASPRVERLMRLRTWQAKSSTRAAAAWRGTDEGQLLEQLSSVLDSDSADPSALPIYIAPTNSIRGLGAFASRELSRGEFIGEYVGEIVLDDEIDGTDRRNSQYLFGLGGGFSVDAHRQGNKTRRINHAFGPQANVRSQIVNHHGIRKIVLTAKVAIPAGDELRFDYGADYVYK